MQGQSQAQEDEGRRERGRGGMREEVVQQDGAPKEDQPVT